MQAFNAELQREKSEDVLSSIEYSFSVFYTLVAGAKSKSHVQFISPDSEMGREVANVLVKYKAGDFLYPHRPAEVARLVSARTQRTFNMHNHTVAWQKHKVRPKGIAPAKGQVNAKYCCFHPAHKDYTYNDEWVDLLVSEAGGKDG